MKDTEEQKLASKLAAEHHSVRVNAAAGAGKSYLLKRIAKSQHARFLYLTFSRQLAAEAKASFPTNAECMTAHGFAFRRLDGQTKLVNKLNRKMTGELGADLLGLEGGTNEKEQVIATLVAAIEKYAMSADERIQAHHLPEADLTTPVIERYLGYARDLWALMSSRTNSIPITHDMYLKLFQLRQEDLHVQYDCILADEGQDFSPVMLEIIKQSQCKRVIVGDRHQQIYAFRGSVNALDAFPDSADAVLSQSFRYGEQVAEFANIVLGFKRNPPSFTIRGTPSRKSVAVVGNPLDLPFEEGQHALIARTNAALFEAAMYITALMPDLKLSFESGLERFLRPIEQCFHLWSENVDAITDYPFVRYKSSTASTKQTILPDRPLSVPRKHPRR
ncbi:UvrD-helicase domain-containing protein [Thalassospira sp. CH_XMU1420-2]|uniref:UvrD-helicase domain-containing protein n=1 Tax=Thalassospira sp. CH_XMU1420-2 TaxID=3107769 RepID=UPI003009A081